LLAIASRSIEKSHQPLDDAAAHRSSAEARAARRREPPLAIAPPADIRQILL
jgi:hypothetical protein